MDPVRFTQVWTRLCGNSPPPQLFSALLAAYSQPHRAYHNADHIDDCLLRFDESKHFAIAPDAVELAILFHDAVYDSHAADNEERSAECETCVKPRRFLGFSVKPFPAHASQP